MQEMFGEVNFTSSILPKAIPNMSEGNISAFSSLLHGRILWKLAASFPKFPSHRSFLGGTSLVLPSQNAPPIFTRVLYIYFLHYSWGVDCSLPGLDILERSTPVFRDDVISSYPSHQVGEEGGREEGTGGGRGREGWRVEVTVVLIVKVGNNSDPPMTCIDC